MIQLQQLSKARRDKVTVSDGTYSRNLADSSKSNSPTEAIQGFTTVPRPAGEAAGTPFSIALVEWQ